MAVTGKKNCSKVHKSGTYVLYYPAGCRFYADQLCISTRYLSAITKQVAEDSAKEIIDENLILELKMALQSTGMSLKEIADKYRFPDQSFFGRYFKKHTECHPRSTEQRRTEV